MEKAREFILKIFKLLMKPEMRILPGQLAFFIVITIIPLVALIATITAALSISQDTVRLAISESVPTAVASIINTIVTGDGINFNIIVFYISAFLLASNGTYSMINTSNEIYKLEPRNIISRRLKAIVMTFILVGLFLFLIIVPVFGSTIFNIITEAIGNNTITTLTENILHIIKYPLILIILYFNIKLMYILAPDEEIPPKSVTKGSAFTTICWILSTEIFAFYIERFTKYDVFYGSISNILVLLLWVYLLSYIYVLGMVINASVYKGELE
jgi:membrane protein